MIGLIFLIFAAIKLGYTIIMYIKIGADSLDRSLFDFKRAMIVSMICVIFLFHPALTNKSLSLFLCSEIDEGKSRMTYHLEYE